MTVSDELRDKDLEVLDRANIDLVLREQGLAAKQSHNMDSYIQIGKLLRLDLLIVAGKHKGYIDWRLIDVHDGTLTGLHVTRWPTEQRQRLGLQNYTLWKGRFAPVVEPDGRHIITSFHEGMLIYDTLNPEKTFLVMEKRLQNNPPPSISNVRWLNTDLDFFTVAVSSELILFSKRSNRSYVWHQKGKEQAQWSS